MHQPVPRIEPPDIDLRRRATAETDDVIARSCDNKRPYGARCARLVAQRMRGQGRKVSPYRCFYCGAWHIGAVPSYEGLRRIADAIRDLHGNRPARDDAAFWSGNPAPWRRVPGPERAGVGRSDVG